MIPIPAEARRMVTELESARAAGRAIGVSKELMDEIWRAIEARAQGSLDWGTVDDRVREFRARINAIAAK